MYLQWREPEANIPKNYSSTSCRLYSLEWKFQREPNLFVSTVNSYMDRTGTRKKSLDNFQVKATTYSAKPEQAWQSNTMVQCNAVSKAASKYKEVCLNDNLLAWPDLQQELIGKIFSLCHGPTVLTADNNSMFLQMQVLEPISSCLKFLWPPQINERVQI